MMYGPSSIPTAHELFFGARTDVDQEEAFFKSIQLRNGTRKTTQHRRLDDLNALVAGLLPPDRPLEIMDVAVSSGVSTAEWLELLESQSVECRMLAGDAVVDGFLVSAGPRLRALVDKTGFLMQLEIAGRAIRLPPPRRRDRLRYWPAIAFMKAAVRLSHAAHEPAPTAAVSRWGIRWQPLKLVSPSLGRMARIQVIEDDILASSDSRGRFHVLRAANILNRAYFDTPTLEKMLINLRERLLPHGLLIVCRTSEDGVNHATVLALDETDRFEVVGRLNEGSEIEDLALRLPARHKR